MMGRRRRLAQLLLFPSPCAWCGKPIPPEKRGDSKFCGKRHRQASWRWRVDGPDLEAGATGPPMRFAYADPPYPGLAHKAPGGSVVPTRLIAELHPNPDNPRGPVDPATVAELAASIREKEDWRLGRPYQVQRIRRTQRVYKWRDVPSGLPPEHVAVGDRVRCVGRIPQKEFILGRVGIVHLIYFRRQGLGGPHWMARVEFKRERQREGWAPRLIYGLPVETVEREK